VLAALHKEGRHGEADVYAEYQPDQIADVEALHPAEDDETDPSEPHTYRNQGGICALCEREEDDVIHPVDAS
jgi:hypothetical protein